MQRAMRRKQPLREGQRQRLVAIAGGGVVPAQRQVGVAHNALFCHSLTEDPLCVQQNKTWSLQPAASREGGKARGHHVL